MTYPWVYITIGDINNKIEQGCEYCNDQDNALHDGIILVLKSLDGQPAHAGDIEHAFD